MARKSEHKRQAKLAKQRTKAKVSARKERQLATQQASLQPYEGRKYQAAAYAPIMFTFESGIHMVAEILKHALTDADVSAGLRRLIGRIKQGELTFILGDHDQLVLSGEPDEMVADIIGHNLKNYRSRLPSHGDLIGIARTLLNSVDLWGSKNHSSRGYLQFLAGFIGQTTNVSMTHDDSADQLMDSTYGRDRFLGGESDDDEGDADEGDADLGSAVNNPPNSNNLLKLGHDWLESNDDDARVAFLQAADKAVRVGNGAEVGATCRRLLGKLPPGNIALELSAVAFAADEGQTVSERNRATGWLSHVAGLLGL